MFEGNLVYIYLFVGHLSLYLDGGLFCQSCNGNKGI